MSSDVSGTTGPKKDHAEYARQYLVEHNLDKDWIVVVAQDTVLQIDLDSPSPDWNHFHKVKNILDEMIGQDLGHRVVTPYTQSFSKSGNVHVQVYLPKSMEIRHRVAWQAALGSDPVREALHLVSISRGEANPILLFEPKPIPLLTGEVSDVVA